MAEGGCETDRSRIARLEEAVARAQRRTTDSAAEAEQARAGAAVLESENLRLVEALDETRQEVHAWKAAHDEARNSYEGVREELHRWYASRLYRTGTIYWRLLRMLTGRPSGPAPVAGTNPPGRSRDVPSSTPDSPAVRPEPQPRPEPERRPERPSGVEPLPRGTYDVLVFSIIDWEFRFQRPQQLAGQFGRKGHRVLYLSCSRFLPEGGPAWQTVRRAENVAEVRIRSARALDIYGGKLEERDLDALEESFSVLARDLAIADAVCKVDIPFWTPLVLRLRERFGWRVVYDCMDEWNNFPGFKEPVLAAEPTLVREADVTLVSADRLLAKWSDVARPLMVRNAVDLDHYTRLYGPNKLLGEVAHPVIGYYGALASWVDVPLLRKVAEAFPDGTIVLAGGQFDVDLGPIAQLRNVRLLGQRPYEEMPLLLWHFDACIIPFLVNDITEATNPVKFYEYISKGKPVVVPDLTELRPFSEVCYLARDHDDFVAKLRLALAEAPDDPRRRKRQEVAAGNDWSARADAIDAAVRRSFQLVSVVVVTYDGLELTKECLRSLLSAETWPRLEVIVVDNGSSDGTPAFLEEIAGTDARVKTILNATNRGFAAANNQGIAASAGEIVVLLNNDTVVPQGLLGRLAAHLRRDAGLGMICPTTNFCGNEAKVDPDYSDLSGLPAYAARRAAENAGVVFDIPIAAMYCVAFRREVLEKVGPLDEAFGIGMFEDDDYALRIREAGLRVVCAEDAYVHHVGQGSFRKLPREEYERLFRENRATVRAEMGTALEAAPDPRRGRGAGVEDPVSDPPAKSQGEGSRPNGARQVGLVLAALLAVLVLTNFNIVFLGQTLVASANYSPFDDRVTHLRPTRGGRFASANWHDLGGTWWQWEPAAVAFSDAFRRGEMPLWDPAMAGGVDAHVSLNASQYFPPYLAGAAAWRHAGPARCLLPGDHSGGWPGHGRPALAQWLSPGCRDRRRDGVHAVRGRHADRQLEPRSGDGHAAADAAGCGLAPGAPLRPAFRRDRGRRRDEPTCRLPPGRLFWLPARRVAGAGARRRAGARRDGWGQQGVAAARPFGGGCRGGPPRSRSGSVPHPASAEKASAASAAFHAWYTGLGRQAYPRHELLTLVSPLLTWDVNQNQLDTEKVFLPFTSWQSHLFYVGLVVLLLASLARPLERPAYRRLFLAFGLMSVVVAGKALRAAPCAVAGRVAGAPVHALHSVLLWRACGRPVRPRGLWRRVASFAARLVEAIFIAGSAVVSVVLGGVALFALTRGFNPTAPGVQYLRWAFELDQGRGGGRGNSRACVVAPARPARRKDRRLRGGGTDRPRAGAAHLPRALWPRRRLAGRAGLRPVSAA